MKMMNKIAFFQCSVKPMLLILIHNVVLFFVIKFIFSRFASSKISWVEADLPNVISVKQPTQKPLEPKTISVRQWDRCIELFN